MLVAAGRSIASDGFRPSIAVSLPIASVAARRGITLNTKRDTFKATRISLGRGRSKLAAASALPAPVVRPPQSASLGVTVVFLRLL